MGSRFIGRPNDLERFRPVEREEVQVEPPSRIELPVMLRASPMDRGGLHTWLATRKAEPDKKREEEMASSVQGSLKEKLRQDLLKAWSGPEAKATVEPRRVPEAPVAVGTMSNQRVEDFAPIKLEAIHPMGRMR